LNSRVACAALSLAAVLLPIAPAHADAPLAPGETVLKNGLTTMVRQTSGAGAVAIEIWIRCPANGWDASEPGIARLAAFSAVSQPYDGHSLRDLVQGAGGDLSVSVFQTATEIAVIAPVGDAPDLQDALVRSVFGGSPDEAAFSDAKTRLAEQQALVAQSSLETLRDAVFSSLFAAGPMRDSTYGDPASLGTTTIDQVRSFIARSYQAANAIAVVVGDVPGQTMSARLGAASVPSGEAPAMPASTPAKPAASPVLLSQPQNGEPGVALGWTGPPISDERAATAMDFLSDYLADPDVGTMAAAARQAHPGATFEGQFVTLESAGIFFVVDSGDGVDVQATSGAMRSALQAAIDQPIGKGEFARAIGAYETRLLRQMDSPEGIADNYGWYFAQGAPAYTPGATDAALAGEYFSNASSLTADYVQQIARQYLGRAPAVIFLSPSKSGGNVSMNGGPS
jgi:predicted Zn-dependent peptidase